MSNFVLIMKKLSLIQFALLSALTAGAKVTLPQLFQSGMVLQRGVEIPVWGQADAGEHVSVVFKKKVYEATAGADGRWQVMLPKQKAGGPYTISVQGSADDRHELQDVLIGDVWLCSGQSNIDVTIERQPAEPLGLAGRPLHLSWRCGPD